MQTTTAVSADVLAQTQHITKGRSLWIEEATRLHDADDHYRVRRHASKNAEVYGNPLEGELHCICCQKYGLGLDGRSHAEEHCELHNTANHTLCTQDGAQEAIIMESVMLIMEQHQSTSTRPAAP